MSSRIRRCCGRMSGFSWIWPVVWPLTWQSKQVTPRLGSCTLAVVGGVEFLLRQGREQQPQPVELHGRQDVLEQPVVVVDRDDFAARHVAQLGPVLKEHRRRELGQERLGQVEVDVEPLEPGNISICIAGKTCRRACAWDAARPGRERRPPP